MSRPRWTGEAAVLAWPATLLVLGSLALARSFSSPLAVLVLALAAVVPLVLVRAALLLGVSRWATASGAVLLLLLTGYLLTADADLALRQVATDVVPRLLTSPRPHEVSPDLLVGPLLLTALVAVLTALGLDSPHRVVPVLAGVALLVAGLLLSAGDADPYGLLSAVLLLTALAGWVLLDDHDEPRRRRGRVAAPVALLGVVVVACGAVVPATDAFDPTELVDPPLRDVVATSPLADVSGWNADGSRELFRVGGDEVPLRLAVLDVYDGLQWTARPRYAALGTQPDQQLPDGPTSRQATASIEVADLGSGFVPTPGRPVDLEVDVPDDADLLVDVVTGSVFDAGPDGQGAPLRGLRYTVTGVTDAPDEAAIQAASVPTGPVVADYLSLPQLPEDLVTYAAQVAAGATTPYQQAIAIQDTLRGSGDVARDAISGSAIYRLQLFLLGDEGAPGAQVGTSEQFASAYAVLARANGLPARVVVGFRPGRADPGAETRTVTGDDALAWPEVYFEGVGWVPFSPTPDDSTFVRQPPPQVQVPPATDPADPVPSATPEPAPPTPAPPAAAPAPRAGTAWALLLVVLAGALLLGAALVLLLARAVRRARHRRHGARGEWSEVLDALHVTPLRPPPHASSEQVAAGLDRLVGGGTATLLAERAERATFAPAPTPVSETSAAAGEGRRDLRELRRAARRSLPPWRRWWWWLDPRVLRR